MLRIHDILVWIRIRESMPLIYTPHRNRTHLWITYRRRGGHRAARLVRSGHALRYEHVVQAHQLRVRRLLVAQVPRGQRRSLLIEKTSTIISIFYSIVTRGWRIRITFRIYLFTRIRILLLIKVMGTRHHWCVVCRGGPLFYNPALPHFADQLAMRIK